MILSYNNFLLESKGNITIKSDKFLLDSGY